MFCVFRHLSTYASCNRCDNGQELMIHLLRDCHYSQQLWQSLKLDQHINFYSSAAMEWFMINLQGSNRTLFSTSCWIIWKARNATIFQDKPWNLLNVINQIHFLFADINTTCLHRKLDKPTCYVGWKPLIAPSVKLNIDGSSFDNPWISGFGGVLCDQTGKWLFGFSRNCGNTTCLKVELFAVYHGSKTAWQRGFKHVLRELDSKIALGLIQDHIDPFSPTFLFGVAYSGPASYRVECHFLSYSSWSQLSCILDGKIWCQAC